MHHHSQTLKSFTLSGGGRGMGGLNKRDVWKKSVYVPRTKEREWASLGPSCYPALPRPAVYRVSVCSSTLLALLCRTVESRLCSLPSQRNRAAEHRTRNRPRARDTEQKRERLFEVRMRTETVSATALGSTGFRYFYSVCFFRLFGPTGLWVSWMSERGTWAFAC